MAEDCLSFAMPTLVLSMRARYPGSSMFHGPAGAAAPQGSGHAHPVHGGAGGYERTPPPLGNCSASMHIIHKIGLSSGGTSHRIDSIEACCGLCAQDSSCAAWTFHATAGNCVTSTEVLPHNSSGTQDATSGSKAPIPPKPWPAPPPPHPRPTGMSGFGPCVSNLLLCVEFACTSVPSAEDPRLTDTVAVLNLTLC